MGIGDSGCGTRRTFTSKCGTIDVKKGPSAATPCEWLVDVPHGHVINLTFVEFSIEDKGMNCVWNYHVLLLQITADAMIVEMVAIVEFNLLIANLDIYAFARITVSVSIKMK